MINKVKTIKNELISQMNMKVKGEYLSLDSNSFCV